MFNDSERFLLFHKRWKSPMPIVDRGIRICTNRMRKREQVYVVFATHFSWSILPHYWYLPCDESGDPPFCSTSDSSGLVRLWWCPLLLPSLFPPPPSSSFRSPLQLSLFSVRWYNISWDIFLLTRFFKQICKSKILCQIKPKYMSICRRIDSPIYVAWLFFINQKLKWLGTYSLKICPEVHIYTDTRSMRHIPGVPYSFSKRVGDSLEREKY